MTLSDSKPRSMSHGKHQRSFLKK